MKALLIIPILFCLQDSVKVDTTQMEIELFFEQKTNVQRATDINTKLDSLILILEAKKDTTNGNNRR